jgi:hypothetical protein
VEAAKAGIEKKHAAWLEKHGGKKKAPKPKPAKKQPPPPEPPPAPEPVFAKKGSEFEAVDAAWREKGK